VVQTRENPVISDWVHVLGGSTEGLLGRLLAQRQAALRGTGGGGTANVFVYSVRAGEILSTRCATTSSW
jgi:hypothetical protein